MESYPNVILTPAGEWKPSYLDDDCQWEDSYDDVSSGANIYYTSYTQSNDVLKIILSAPQYKDHRTTFTYDVAFTKGATDNKLLFDIPELDTQKIDNYDGFSTSSELGPFAPNYVYATTNHLIDSSLFITKIIPAAYTIAILVLYCINGISRRNFPVDVKKLRRFFLFKPDNVVMKTLDATTQFGGFNLRILMIQSNKRFPYNRPLRHKDDAIDNLFSYVQAHDSTATVETIVITKTLLTNVYAIGSKSGLNIVKVLQERFLKHGIPIDIWYDNAQ